MWSKHLLQRGIVALSFAAQRGGRFGVVVTQSVRHQTTLRGGISDDLLLTLSLNHGTSGTSQKELVANLKKNNIIKTEAVYKAMLETDRADFIDENTTENPWKDAPVTIGSNATISSPHMHAIALEALQNTLQPGSRALDVGCGSGYLTVCMARMLSGGPKQGFVLGIDHVDALVAKSARNAGKHHEHLLTSRQLGFQRASPLPLAAAVSTTPVPQGVLEGEIEVGEGFDSIHCGAAVMTVPPNLIQWLAPGGQLLIPVSKHGASFAKVASAFADSALMAAASGGTDLGEQELLLISKSKDGAISSRSLMTVIYSPLTLSPPRPPPPPESEQEIQAQIDKVQAKLKEWQKEYKEKNASSKPSSSAMSQDPVASVLLAEYSKLAAKLKLCKRRAASA